MMNYLSLKEELKNHFKDFPKRYNHSIGVSEFAVELNHKFNFGLDDELLKITGILHDYAKIYDTQTSLKMLSKYLDQEKVDYYAQYPNVIHAILGAYLVKELYNISDELFDAIYYHTTGTANMTKLMEVIYVADVVERGRTYKDAQFFRNLVLDDFYNGLYKILESIIEMLSAKHEPIEKNTQDAYKYYRKKVLENEI